MSSKDQQFTVKMVVTRVVLDDGDNTIINKHPNIKFEFSGVERSITVIDGKQFSIYYGVKSIHGNIVESNGDKK